MRKIARLFKPAGAAGKPIAGHDAAALGAAELDKITAAGGPSSGGVGGGGNIWQPPN